MNKSLMMIAGLFAAGGLMAATAANPNATAAAAAVTGTPAPAACKCGCKKCAPNGTLVKSADGKLHYRGCFQDKNKDSVCDNSAKAGKKCKNNCSAIDPASAAASDMKLQNPCANCPCPTNCAKCLGKIGLTEKASKTAQAAKAAKAKPVKKAKSTPTKSAK